MVRSINFQQIQAFKMVMETGTTTKAAQALNTTQPSISRRIAELQRVAELQLFDLYNGRLRPTREGHHFYQAVRRHFDGLEKIETALHNLKKSGTGVLRIGCTPTLASGLLPKVINRFMQLFPSAHINLQTLGTQQLIDYLRQDLLDFALTTGAIEQSDIDATVILRASAVCVLPMEEPFTQVDYVRLEDLHRYRLLLLNDTDDIVIRLKALLRRQQFPEDVVLETNSSITICSLVAAGVGVGIVNPFVANSFAEKLLIKQLRPYVEVPVTLARSSIFAPSMLTNRFIELLPKDLDDVFSVD